MKPAYCNSYIKIVDNFLDPIDLKKVQEYTFTAPYTPKKWKIQQSNVDRESCACRVIWIESILIAD